MHNGGDNILPGNKEKTAFILVQISPKRARFPLGGCEEQNEEAGLNLETD